jgi:hypothetical protein
MCKTFIQVYLKKLQLKSIKIKKKVIIFIIYIEARLLYVSKNL